MEKCFAIALLLIYSVVTKAQTVIWEREEWAKDITNMLSEFQTCGGEISSDTPCNTFLGKAMQKVYHIDDFFQSGSTSYLSANQIVGYVENSDNWIFLGEADNQETLTNAQGYANLGKAVIAVIYNNKTHGHVCLIMPGNLSYSKDWKLNCPNSASFFLNKIDKSYVGQKLSYAFKQPVGVKIYGRNF